MNVETVDQYLARGGVVTHCPPAGSGELDYEGVIERVGPTMRAFYAIVKANGHRYHLSADEWRGQRLPVKGDAVRFVPSGGNGKTYARFCRPAAA